MTIRGKLERRDLEGGTWVLVAGREQWVLVGEVPAALAGREVEVEGDKDEGFGLFMQGPQLRVRRIVGV